MTKVLLTTDVVGGVWDFCLVLADQLRRRHTVTLLALGSPSLAQRQAAHDMDVELISEPLKLEWMQDSSADVEATRKLVSDLARDVDADVVHANQCAAACLNVEAPVLLTVHSDVLSWHKWTLGTSDISSEWRPYVGLVREALTRADRVVAVSAFLAREIEALYDVDRRIDVIYNGWPAARSRPSKDPLTLAAGRVWDAAKNIQLVAAAARGWNGDPVYLAGETSHPDGGRASVPEPLRPLGLLSREELDTWLDRAKIYVSAARYDPFGLLPLQAALRGCALLLSDIPSYLELWDGAATFFRAGDADDLRRHWQGLLDSKDAQTARERALNLFSPERMARAYERLYATIGTRVSA